MRLLKLFSDQHPHRHVIRTRGLRPHAERGAAVPFLMLLLTLLLPWTSAWAQTGLPIEALSQARPKGVIGPTSPAQCNALQQQWTQYRLTLNQVHDRCLQQQSKLKGVRSGRTCSAAPCQAIHDLREDRQLSSQERSQLDLCRRTVQDYEQRQRATTAYQKQRETERQQRAEQLTKESREQSAANRNLFEDANDRRARQMVERQELERQLADINKRDGMLAQAFVKALQLELTAKDRENRQVHPELYQSDPSPTREAIEGSLSDATEDAIHEQAQELAMKGLGLDGPMDAAQIAMEESAKQTFEQVMGKRLAESAGRVSKFMTKHGGKFSTVTGAAGIVLDPIRTSEFDSWLDGSPEAGHELSQRIERAKTEEALANRSFQQLDQYVQAQEDTRSLREQQGGAIPHLSSACTAQQPCLQATRDVTPLKELAPKLEVPTGERYWSKRDAMTWVAEHRLPGIWTPFEDPRTGEAGFVVKQGQGWKPSEDPTGRRECANFRVVLLNDEGEVLRKYQEEVCR